MKPIQIFGDVLGRWFGCIIVLMAMQVAAVEVHAQCPEGGCRIEILGTSFGRDNIRITEDNLAEFVIDWVAYGGCPEAWGNSPHTTIDGGAGWVGTPDDAYYATWSPLIESDPDGMSGQIHHSLIKQTSFFRHPCKHTLTITGDVFVSDRCGYGTTVHRESNPITVWIERPDDVPNSDSYPDLPGSDTQASCSNGPPPNLEPTTGCPVDIADGRMFHEMVDLRIDGPLPIEFVRRYDSNHALDNLVLGFGWQHNGMTQLEAVLPHYDPRLGQMRQVLIDSNRRRITFNCEKIQPPPPLEVCLQQPPPVVCFERNCDGVWRSDSIDHLTLTQFSDYEWQVKDEHGGTKYDFEKADFWAQGRLKAVTDRNGNTLTYHYDNSGNIDTITDAFQRVMTISYASGRVHTVSAGCGSGARTVSYHYDGHGDLDQVTFPDGSSVIYTYDSSHQMTEALDAARHVIEHHDYNGNQVDNTYSDSGNYSYAISRQDPVHPEVRNGRNITTKYKVDLVRGVATERTEGPGCSSCGDAGNATNKEYDEYLNLQKITDGVGVETVMTYDDHGNVLTRTENCILQTNGACDPDPDPPSISRTTTYSYDDPNNPNLPTSIITPTTGTCAYAHTVITNEYSLKGNLTHSETSGCNGVDGDQAFAFSTTYEYYEAAGEHGQLKSVNGPRTDVLDKTIYLYFSDTDGLNDRGRLKQVTNALEQPTQFAEYDLFGNVGKVTDANGVETTYTYNFRDRVRFARIRQSPGEDSADDIVTEYEYDAVGNLHRLRKPNCVAMGGGCDYTFEYEYDEVNRLEEVHDAYGNKIAYRYDHEGNRTRGEFKDPAGTVQRVTDFKYDAFNRLEYVCYNPTDIDNCGPDYDYFQYNADGTRHTARDPKNHTTTSTYDAFKRLETSVQTVGADTLTTRYQYDVQDGLIKVTDPRGLETNYVNDDLGWRWKTVSPDTGATINGYDPAGNLTSTTDANSVIVTRTYDEMNRPTHIDYANDNLDVTYSYDSIEAPFGIGRLTRMDAPFGTTTGYEYDQRGLLTNEGKLIDGLKFTTGYDYDKSGNLIELRYPSIDIETRQGAVDYHYDDAERLDGVSVLYNGEPVAIAGDIQYKPFGPRTSMTFGNSLLDTRTFDTRYQLGTWNLSNAVPETLLSYTHTFNADGNLEKIIDGVPPVHGRSFVYDAAHRLASAEGPWGLGTGCSGQSYTYDLNGNRTCKDESGTATSYQYPSNSNRLQSLNGGAVTFSYDANGNTTSDGTHTYAYSNANRLATVDGTGTYTYDGQNRRVRKATTQTTHYFYDPSGRILTEMTHDQEAHGGGIGWGQDYVYLPDGPVARVDWSVIANPNYHECSERGEICAPPRIAIADLLYYHLDHLGTPIAMSNQSGELVWQGEYLPFGELFSTPIATVSNNLRFPGQYFDLETGLHQNWFRDYDPKTGRYVEADPIGPVADTNLYNYVANNPLRWFDVLGLYRRGDVIYRTDPAKRDSADVAFIWDDPTPEQDGNGDEQILAFGNPSRCPGTCTGKARLVRIDSSEDPYAGFTIVGNWKPRWWQRDSDSTYVSRWQDWQRTNPSWTLPGVQPQHQCFNLVNAMTGTRSLVYLGGLQFGPPDLSYWRTRTGAP